MTTQEQPADKAEYTFVCPGCGGETDALREGYCEPCWQANQAYLDEHNAAYDRWQTMDEWKRELEIKNAVRRA